MPYPQSLVERYRINGGEPSMGDKSPKSTKKAAAQKSQAKAGAKKGADSSKKK
jgi:hypothetical protein